MHVLDHIIQRPVLCDRNKGWLMVCSGVDGGQTISTRTNTTRNGNIKLAVHSCVIQSLEEYEAVRGGGSGLRERGELLNDNMRMALNVAGTADLLRCSEEVVVCVDEETSIQIVDGHHDSEGLVRGNRIEVLRVDELGRWHAGVRSNDTHRSRVAGPTRNLLSVGDVQVGHSEAEVDEVVRRRQRRNLSCGGPVMAQ